MASTIFILAAAALAGSVTGSTLMTGQKTESSMDNAFEAYIAKHNRPYKHGSDEHPMRKALFIQRLAAVHAHNANPDRLWNAAPSHFTDRTEAERKAVFGYRRGVRPGSGAASFLEVGSYVNQSIDLPKEKNWLHLQTAHRVKDQGSCGSCWAVTTGALLEAHYEIYKAKDWADRSFSDQEIVNCVPNPRECGGQGGCKGATVELGLDYIVKNGLATADQVPYIAKDGECVANKKQNLATIHGAALGGAAFGLVGYKRLKENEDAPLAEAVATVGPVGVSAAADTWMEYESGIHNGCGKDVVVNHAITLYGYGEHKGKRYWLIRNSWGSWWGEQGFIRLLRQDEGVKYCGTDHNNQEGIGCKDDPKEVPVCGMCGILFDSSMPTFHSSVKATGSFAEVENKNFGQKQGPGLMRSEPRKA